MTTDEQQIRSLVQTWMAATKARDTPAVLELMEDDAVFLVAGRPPMTKSEFAKLSAEQSNSNSPEIDGTSEIQEVNVSGEWAYLWSKLRVVVKPPGDAAPIVRAGHTLTVLRKREGKWRLFRDANMLTKVDAAGA